MKFYTFPVFPVLFLYIPCLLNCQLEQGLSVLKDRVSIVSIVFLYLFYLFNKIKEIYRSQYSVYTVDTMDTLSPKSGIVNGIKDLELTGNV
jgi:hypothetical protein